MKTGKIRLLESSSRTGNIQKYLVLVPHRDARQILQKYSEEKLKNGLKGVYQFPCVAPLAYLGRPLTADELKLYARKLREKIKNDKFTAVETDTIPFQIDNQEFLLVGSRLTGDWGLGSGDWVAVCNQSMTTTKKDFEQQPLFPTPYSLLPAPILGIFLHDKNKSISLPSQFPLPNLSFRAAAVANLRIKPIYLKNGAFFGFKWKIGKIFWLPKEDKAAQRQTRLPKADKASRSKTRLPKEDKASEGRQGCTKLTNF